MHAPSLRRKTAIWVARRRWIPYVELATFAALILIALGSYLVLSGGVPGAKLLTPPLMALLLVANLLPAITLIMLIGRRVAKRRAAMSAIGGGARLHARLVGIFSLISSVPMLIVVLFASLLFQYGVEFSFSQRARAMLENASGLAQGYNQEKQHDIASQTITMAGDLRDYLNEASTDSPAFAEGYAWQVLSRNLSESAIVEIGKAGVGRTVAMVNPDARPVERRVSGDVIARLQKGEQVVVTGSNDRLEAVTRLYPNRSIYLYTARIADQQVRLLTDRARTVLRDYDALLDRSRRMQLQFNAALYFMSLLIVIVAVIIALRVADRLVRPVAELVNASRRVTEGDLSARVAGPMSRDEVGTLGRAFNRMTGTLQEQTEALDRRRALMEAVLSGVSAGVVSIDANRTVQLINSSARHLLDIDESAIGRSLVDVAPELDALFGHTDREAIVEIAAQPEPRTLAVKIVRDAAGHVLTFDDITQQLSDQRRAAWADVARRIAHEIKNPLTPIQLAAERLKRRYAREVTSDPATFSSLTDTIVRQVGDLRRIVDEFSSFARMPKPLFREESLVDIARQAIFLHEVAHPAIRFALNVPSHPPRLVCDRRQLAQALTNIIKNGVEAIGQQKGGEQAGGDIIVTIDEAAGHVRIAVADSGIGLPAERERIVEPYVTTRQRGTGLGLAIVLKIVEEHGGTMHFGDREGGGTVVTLDFDPEQLARISQHNSGEGATEPKEPSMVEKT